MKKKIRTGLLALVMAGLSLLPLKGLDAESSFAVGFSSPCHGLLAVEEFMILINILDCRQIWGFFQVLMQE